MDRIKEYVSDDSNEAEQKRFRGSLEEVTSPFEFKWKVERDTTRRVSKRFRRTETTSVVSVNHNLGTFSNVYQVSVACDKMYEDLMAPYIRSAQADDVISVTLSNNDLNTDIYLPPRRVETFNREDLLDAIFKVAQSNDKFLMTGKFLLNVSIMKALVGGGRLKAPETIKDRSTRKKSVVTISDSGHGCFAKALALGIYLVNKGRTNEKLWDKMRKDRGGILELEAKKLCRRVGLAWDVEVCSLQLKDIQAKLDVQLIVVDALNPKHLIFKGKEQVNTVYLEYIDAVDREGHYNTITKIQGYMGKPYYCRYCHLGYNEAHKHMCRKNCPQCNGYPKCVGEQRLTCLDCNRIFFTLQCYDRHKNICSYRKVCPICERTFTGHHQCLEYVCQKCNHTYKLQPHYCFIGKRPEARVVEQDKMPKIFVAYDIESIQAEISYYSECPNCSKNINLKVHKNQCPNCECLFTEADVKSKSTFQHLPNLLISKTVCDYCWCEDRMQKICDSCEKCGLGKETFFGVDCITKFCTYIFCELANKAEKIGSKVYVFAHNARGYDAHFILQDVWKRNFTEKNIILQGRKIVMLSTGNVRFIDSLAFFLQPLSALPKAFGLHVELEKGYFPHHFNVEENYNYAGPLPPIENYGLSYMNPDAATEFRTWYAQQVKNNVTFNFKDELMKYCENDVDILVKSIMVFRKNVTHITGLDPFTYCFTLAALGLHIYRTKFLEDDSIGITPIGGYTNKRNQSKSGQCWLDWSQIEYGVKIIREYHIGNRIADGFDPINKRAFEFFGCRFHGCPCYYKNRRNKVVQQFDKTPNQLYTDVDEKLKYYKRLGCDVVSIWECEFNEIKKTDKFFKEYCKSRYQLYTEIEKYGGAKISEAFFGGRTNNLRFHYECDEDEEICYVDFISLYPDVLKNRDYPVGHPVVIREDFDTTLQSYFGFVKCKVLPPRGLYIPVLPFKVNGKLVFPLCVLCAKDKSSKKCCHADGDRIMINTWTTEELKIAIARGYKVICIIEILHYDQKTDKLFKGYINMWLKIKQQASGWPAWCTTEKLKWKFIKEYELKEGILLEYDQIVKNPALRFIAKIMLNSFWGKLAQRVNLPKTDIVNSLSEYYDIINDDRKDIKADIMVTNNTMLVTSEFKDSEDAPQGNTNVAIASYVTAYARLKLLLLMEKIELQRPFSVLYHDTDSVIFLRKLIDPPIETGDYLGELTNEFAEYRDARCTKFASLGPKNYGYELLFDDGTTKSNLKVKGLTLTESTLNLVNFKEMMEMAKEYNIGKVKTIYCPQFNIQCDSHHVVSSRYFEKIYRATSDKRVIEGSITLPYGY